MATLADTAPAFVELAHRIVWATGATVDTDGRPVTRILHPVWEWDGELLSGRIATSPLSPKARHLASTPHLSLTYWTPTHDTCTARCRTAWLDTHDDRQALWERFAGAPAPLGYDPSIIPGWDSPDAPAFGVLQLTPDYLQVLTGADLGSGQRGLIWRRE